jgi:hypothetical protein
MDFNPLRVAALTAWVRLLYQVADAMIKAGGLMLNPENEKTRP